MAVRQAGLEHVDDRQATQSEDLPVISDGTDPELPEWELPLPMNKRITVANLGMWLKKLVPAFTGITNGLLTLTPGVELEIPDDFQPFSFTDEGNGRTRIDVHPMTLHIEDSEIPALLRLLGLHGGPEPVSYLSVGPADVQTKVGFINIIAVDG
jgi:hypothetical protein